MCVEWAGWMDSCDDHYVYISQYLIEQITNHKYVSLLRSLADRPTNGKKLRKERFFPGDIPFLSLICVSAPLSTRILTTERIEKKKMSCYCLEIRFDI